jgi:hypothetical protein
MVAKALRQAHVVAVVRRATSDCAGAPWDWDDFVDLSDRATHRRGIFRSSVLSVFAKLSTDSAGMELFETELKSLALLRAAAKARTPTPVGPGVFVVGHDTFLLLLEGLTGRHGNSRTRKTGGGWAGPSPISTAPGGATSGRCSRSPLRRSRTTVPGVM